jgi:hypothetical protein
MSAGAGTAAKRKGRPPLEVPPPPPMPWESKVVAKQVQNILDAMELSSIDDEVRLYFQRSLYRSKMFGGGGREKIILLIRTILESEGNEDALIEPIVNAVCSCMRPEWTDLGLVWIETFDKFKLTALLETMRSLDLFAEKDLGYHLGISLRNKLRPILEPLVPKPAPPIKAKRKLPTKPLKRRTANQPLRRLAA